MIKFTKLIKESKDIEEIEDYFLNINHLLGNPIKHSSGSGNFIIHEFKWIFDVDLNEYNDASQVDKFISIFESIKELKASQSRIGEYDIDFKINGDGLYVRVTPKSTKNTNTSYKFFIEQRHRITELRYSEIVRFFKDRGYSVTKIEDNDDEGTQSNSIIIYTNSNDDVTSEFATMLEDELYENAEEIDTEFTISSRNNYISIYPKSEKAYIEIVK